MALVRLGRLGDLVSVAQVAQWLQTAPPSPARLGKCRTDRHGPQRASRRDKKKITDRGL